MGMLIPGCAVLRAGIVAPLLCVAAVLMVADAAHAARRGGSRPATPALDAQAVDAAQFSAPSGKGGARGPSPATTIKAEILLDRAGFSPGQIDGQTGSNDQKALATFQAANGLKPSGHLDAETWSRLTATSNDPVLVEYEIEPGDVKGPFNKSIPTSFEKKAELKNLNYTGPRELLGVNMPEGQILLPRIPHRSRMFPRETTKHPALIP